MLSSELINLLEKFLDDSASPEEIIALRQMLKDPGTAVRAKEWMETVLAEDRFPAYTDYDTSSMFDEVYAKAATEEPFSARRVPLLRSWWAAAAVALLLCMAAYFWLIREKAAPDAPSIAATDIQPGHAGAILILADGSQVSLDSIKNGLVALQGGATAKVVNGNLYYEGSDKQIVYNTLFTPKGRQFQVTLPDGTQVWLNSVSSIKYPLTFSGDNRTVTITGEAYFEVAKNAGKPFLVEVPGKAVVEVTGTHFNVNAYANESSINTTLLEGHVKVFRPAASNAAVALQPGQQARINGPSKAISILDNVDTEHIMAWKKGQFSFDGIAFEESMRQLERWYNIEVIYASTVPDLVLAGKMTRDVPLNALLKNLEIMGLHYRLEGRKLIIMP